MTLPRLIARGFSSDPKVMQAGATLLMVAAAFHRSMESRW